MECIFLPIRFCDLFKSTLVFLVESEGLRGGLYYRVSFLFPRRDTGGSGS